MIDRRLRSALLWILSVPRSLWGLWGLWGLCTVLWIPSGHAQIKPSATPSLVGEVFVNDISLPPASTGERFSSWALQDPVAQSIFREPGIRSGSSTPYLLGTSWIIPQEEAAQAREKEALLAQLRKLRMPTAPAEKEPTADTKRRSAKAPSTLEAWIAQLPITGRVALPNADPRYLEVRPKLDPILQTGQTIAVPPTPSTITVIQTDGRLCKVRYRPNVEARHYLAACRSTIASTENHPDWAWIIEPNGEVRKVSVANWNAAAQVLPAPGAWLWAPPRYSVWSSREGERFSNQLAQFLATQFPSGIEAGVDQGARRATLASPNDGSLFQMARDLPITTNLWGSVGVLQTPSARFYPAGTGAVSVGWYQPYTNVNFFLTPIDWFEFGFRYTNINNIPYGSQYGQSYKDKSIDAKIRLLPESAYLPELTVGARDLLGTGLFSGEYVVANKRYQNFDASLGIGWGSLGTRNNIRNPMISISPNFSSRPPPQTGEGGTTSSYYFHGQTALFGGVQYHTPIDKLILKAEVDGNNYQQMPFGDNIPVKSIFNFGAVYQTKYADFTLGVLGNRQVMLSVNLHTRLDQLKTPKLAEAKPIPVGLKPVASYERSQTQALESALQKTTPVATPTIAASAPLPNPSVDSSSAIAASLTQRVATNTAAIGPAAASQRYRQTLLDFEVQTGWKVDDLREVPGKWIINLQDATGIQIRERLDRGIAVLHRDAPNAIGAFELRFYNFGLLVSNYEVNRLQWMKTETQFLPPLERGPSIEPLSTLVKRGNGALLAELDQKPYTTDYGLNYFQIVGGPDTPLLFSLSAQGEGLYKFNRNTWVTGTINVRMVDNFGKFTYDGPTNLPPVRTDIRQYMTTSIATMPNLQVTNVQQFGQNHFTSVYGGYLEMMFAGVGGEYLWRPNQSTLAVGVDINQVRQRQFNQWTALQSYGVTTGHLTTYWDTGLQDILVKFSVGQYLAGDRGGTLDLSKVFANGVKIGVFATRTNVTAEQYGEGSFDKGIYVTIPFDAFFAKHTDSEANLLWLPLLRDGGQKLYRKYTLYDITKLRDSRALSFGAQ